METLPEATDKASLVDITAIVIDTDAPADERVRQYLAQIKNPYAFRVGNVAVRLVFAPEGGTLRDAIRAYLTMIRQ